MGDNDLSNKAEELKGRAKQAAGDLTDNRDLKREGKIEEGTAEVKQKADDLGDKAGDLAGRAGDAIKNATTKDK
ncbi:MAG TPA: CsbD family protein [Actinomycetota bacterium]|nr:CsbD family protein [Actinomycetota bacterium]